MGTTHRGWDSNRAARPHRPPSTRRRRPAGPATGVAPTEPQPPGHTAVPHCRGLGGGGGGVRGVGGVRPNTQTSRLLKVRASERVQSRSPGEVAVLHKGSPPNAPTPSQTPPSLRPSPPACAPCATTAFCLSIMTPSCRRFSDRTVCVEEWAVGVPGLQRARGPEAPKHPVATVLLKGRWGGGGQGCIRREGTCTSEVGPEAVRQAVGGGCRSGWGRLLSVTNAIEAGTWRQGDSGWA